MGALRTGAASGIATKYMARTDAARLGVIGTGRQARTQVEAICKVRPITEIVVYSRSAENRAKFCHDIAATGRHVSAVDSAEAAVRACDIVVTATTATDPVLHGD